MSVGMDMTPKRMASACCSSTFTFPTCTSGCLAANSSTTGLCIRHGPHHEAQKSTSVVPAEMAASKSPAVKFFTDIYPYSFLFFSAR